MWNETDGRRGANEIGSCLYRYINSLSPLIQNVCLYSDNCTGQNRNQYVAACLLYTVNKSASLQIIDHKFLESGHTQMGSDSIHAAVEFAKKATPVYAPSQWHTVIALARKKKICTSFCLSHIPPSTTSK